MPILSGGTLLLSSSGSTVSETSTTYYPPGSLALTNLFASHAALYRKQVWVFTVVRKLATATARLPLKVYERRDDGSRVLDRGSAYARLIQRPNDRMDPFYFWLWTASTMEVYGEAMWAKVRDRQGQVVELWPLHPAAIYTRRNDRGDLFYGYIDRGEDPLFEMPASDVVHFRSYNPDDTIRGMSPLEPLRQTLLNEDAARRATSAFWQNGARPSVALSHPGNLSDAAAARLKARWDAIASGVDNTGKTVVLEEGMEPKVMSLSAEEAQYIETRKLNREEVCAAYDVPPPVVHILDRATFSNITEQMRSMYRDTMAPRLGLLESVLDQQLRPEFGNDALYAEFLLDEVLRGDFEVRLAAMGTALQTGQLTINEARALENRPSVAGGDVPLVNSAMVPLSEAGPQADQELPAAMVRSVTDRAGRRKSLAEIDRDALVAGLNGHAQIVLDQLDTSLQDGVSVPQFCSRLWQLAKE